MDSKYFLNTWAALHTCIMQDIQLKFQILFFDIVTWLKFMVEIIKILFYYLCTSNKTFTNYYMCYIDAHIITCIIMSLYSYFLVF